MQNFLEDKAIHIRTDLQPGDIGYITMMHGRLYHKEYGYSLSFESYVAAGLHEFYQDYNPDKDGIWILEKENRIIGCIVLMHRNRKVAQLRYFLLLPEYRGQGLGKYLMQLFMAALHEKGYSTAYLWTTLELNTAANLYQQAGFRIKKEIESVAFGVETMEQLYELQL